MSESPIWSIYFFDASVSKGTSPWIPVGDVSAPSAAAAKKQFHDKYHPNLLRAERFNSPAPEPPMTRCPKCGEPFLVDSLGERLCSCPAPAPHDAPPDFEKKCPNPHCENGMIRDTAVGCATCHGGLDIARSLQAANEAMRSIGERCAGPKWEHARDIDLQRQARAYADAAVKAERKKVLREVYDRWLVASEDIDDFIEWLTNERRKLVDQSEARDDHR